MTKDPRRSERERRQAGPAAAGSGVEPDGRDVPPARLKQMLSVRMEPELVRAVRRIAERQGISVSDLMREAAMELVARDERQTVRIDVTATVRPVVQVHIHASAAGIAGPDPVPTRGQVTQRTGRIAS